MALTPSLGFDQLQSARGRRESNILDLITRRHFRQCNVWFNLLSEAIKGSWVNLPGNLFSTQGRVPLNSFFPMKLVKTSMPVRYAKTPRLTFYLKSLKARVLWPLNVSNSWFTGTHVHLENCKLNKKSVLLTCVCFLQMDCFAAPFVSLSFSFSPSPSPPTHCSMMSAGDLIEQIDCKCNRGVWVNQSNTVKQFFGHEGISLAGVELIRAHSPQRWPGF